MIVRSEDKKYRQYVTDALKAIALNTARQSNVEWMNTRYSDVIDHKPQDTRTAEEIAAEVIKNAGLVVR